MQPNFNFAELRSEEIQELLTRPPRWLLRWGIVIVSLLLAAVLLGTWAIHYPDLVQASFKLVAADAPKAVLSRTDGKIVRLFAKEGQSVKAGVPLAYLESTANHDEVQKLTRELQMAWNAASKQHLEKLQHFNLSTYHQLGELQSAYQTFEQAHIQLRAYLIGGFYSQKRAILMSEMNDLKLLAQQLKQQRLLQAQDALIAQEDYEAQQRLAAQKVIPLLDLKREESKNISRQLLYKQATVTILNNTSTQRIKQKELLELDKQVAEERDKFLQALNTLQSETKAWQAKYILTAPVDGHVYFSGTVQENQSVVNAQELFSVAPPNTEYTGELHIPQQNAGKVQVGQEVIIKFVGYPYQEYGSVRGRIMDISNISFRDSVFLAKVVLPKGLETNYGKHLVYKTGMAASADIQTTDSRLLEKLFYQLRKVTGNK